MKHMNTAELFSQTLAQSVGGVGIEKASVGDKPDNATVPYAMVGPANGTDVTVV
jgi:hypothetical protein